MNGVVYFLCIYTLVSGPSSHVVASPVTKDTIEKILGTSFHVNSNFEFTKPKLWVYTHEPNPNFEFEYGDVTVLEQMKEAVHGCDAIIHLAAIVGFPACKSQPALATAVNVEGTRNIIFAREAYNPKIPLVYASTGSVYGKVEDICTEESALNAVSLYGVNKKVAEEMVGTQENTVSFRFATGFGVSPCMRVNLLVNDFVYQAITNKILTIFQADFRRTFIHVRDMARAFTMGVENMGNWKHNVIMLFLFFFYYISLMYLKFLSK